MSKYDVFKEYLISSSQKHVRLPFHMIEKLLGFSLPKSARTYQAWWANDYSHSHATSWLGANYKVSYLSLENSTVEFIKCEDLYISNKTVYKTPYQQIEITGKNTDVKTDKVINKLPPITLMGYQFQHTEFTIIEKDIPSPFLNYKGKIVSDLLKDWHYVGLKSIIESKYPQFLNQGIQEFMKFLVERQDNLYLRFLNKNGADRFCRFALTDQNVFYKRGLYLYSCQGQIVYIGRCRDNFYQRFNANYGIIQPINCYKAGQSTNTHINSFVNQYGQDIEIYLCPMVNEEEIIATEIKLINKLCPVWNRKR